jgi:hypothetical protein
MSEKKTRTLTVLNRTRFPKCNLVPDVRMSGYWLGRAGFLPGSRFSVTVAPGRLVVKVIAPPGPGRRHGE